MSATNATTNYSLPLFIGTDKPAWLVDWNSAMTDIDGQMKINATAIQANATSISGLSTTVSAHTTSISTITGEISTLSTGLNSAQGAINTIQSLIGNGEPTTTDKTLIGAINEIYGMITGGGDAITANNVVYDNTTSGLTATDVQAAIDELAQGGSATVEADDVTYDNTTSGLTATNVQAAIDEVVAGAGGGSKFTPLWSNSNPTQDVTSGTSITLSSADYDLLLVITTSSTSSTRTNATLIVPKGYDLDLNIVSVASSLSAASRRLTRVSDTSYTAGDCTAITGSSSSTNNSFLIPIAIYGIKV